MARLESPRLHFNEAGTRFSINASLSCLPLENTEMLAHLGLAPLLQGVGVRGKAGQRGLGFLHEGHDAIVCPGKERNTSHGLNVTRKLHHRE